MNVQQLIDELTLVEDKSINVVIQIESGRSCFSSCDDVFGRETEVDVDEGDEEVKIFVIGGEETSFE